MQCYDKRILLGVLLEKLFQKQLHHALIDRANIAFENGGDFKFRKTPFLHYQRPENVRGYTELQESLIPVAQDQLDKEEQFQTAMVIPTKAYLTNMLNLCNGLEDVRIVLPEFLHKYVEHYLQHTTLPSTVDRAWVNQEQERHAELLQALRESMLLNIIHS